MRKYQNFKLATVAALLLTVIPCFTTTACKAPSWAAEAESIISISAPIIGSIITMLDPKSAGTAQQAVTGVNTLIGLFQQIQANPSTTTLGQINSTLGAITTELSNIEASANIADPATKTKVAAILALVTQEFQAVAQLVAAQTPVASSARAAKVGKTSLPKLDHKAFIRAYQKARGGDARFPALDSVRHVGPVFVY